MSFLQLLPTRTEANFREKRRLLFKYEKQSWVQMRNNTRMRTDRFSNWLRSLLPKFESKQPSHCSSLIKCVISLTLCYDNTAPGRNPRGLCSTTIFCFSQNFIVHRKFSFKHIIKTKIFPPKHVFPPLHPKTWLRACPEETKLKTWLFRIPSNLSAHVTRIGVQSELQSLDTSARNANAPQHTKAFCSSFGQFAKAKAVLSFNVGKNESEVVWSVAMKQKTLVYKQASKKRMYS